MTAPFQSDAWAIGVDVGGTKIAAGLVRFPEAKIYGREIIPTQPERGSDKVLMDVHALILRQYDCASLHQCKPLGVGIGVPELVDLEGRITSATTVDWRHVAAAHFAPRGPVTIDADIRAAALGEALFGAGNRYRLFLYVNVGTGISCCLVQDGKPFRGTRGNALVLGSGPDVALCAECESMTESVLEDYASGPGIVRRYLALIDDENVKQAKEILANADAHDPVAVRVVTQAATALGNRVGLLSNVLDPEAVIIGGGLGLAGGTYWQFLQDAARSAIWDANTRRLPIINATFGADAGLVGAASLAIREK